MKDELAFTEGLLESSNKLAAKDATEHFDGKKEPLTLANPVGVIERQAPGGNDAMDMGMKPEVLTPSVQHGEEADFRATVSGIALDFEKGFRTGTEQQIVEDLLVLQGQRRQPVG